MEALQDGPGQMGYFRPNIQESIAQYRSKYRPSTLGRIATKIIYLDRNTPPGNPSTRGPRYKAPEKGRYRLQNSPQNRVTDVLVGINGANIAIVGSYARVIGRRWSFVGASMGPLEIRAELRRAVDPLKQQHKGRYWGRNIPQERR